MLAWIQSIFWFVLAIVCYYEPDLAMCGSNSGMNSMTIMSIGMAVFASPFWQDLIRREP